MGEQVDASFMAQGSNAGVAQSNQILGSIQSGFKLGTEIGKRQQLSNLYNTAKENNTQPSWEDIGAVYAKYGDTEGADRAKAKGFKERATKFGERAKIFMDQAEKAYASGNDDAILDVQANANNDPYMQEFVGDVKFLPNNQITYLVQEDQEILMDGGVVKEAGKGDQVIAYRGKGEDGQPKVYATSIKPTGLSSAVQRGKNAAATTAGNPGGGTPKSLNALADDVSRATIGTGKFSDEIYSDAIERTNNLGTAYSTYKTNANRLDAEITNGYYQPATVNKFQKQLDGSIKKVMKSNLDNWKATKNAKDMIKNGANPQELILAFMETNGLPPEDFDNVYSVLFEQQGS